MGHWRFVLVAVVCLGAAALLSWSLYPEEPKLAGNSAYQEQAAGYRAGGADCQPSEVDRLKRSDRARRAVACQEAEEQHRLQANDLIQQRRSADAADAMAVFSYEQTRIGAWGVALGFITMMAAIAAAVFAERAAHHTKSSATLYRAREQAELVPSLQANGWTTSLRVNNMGPTQAIIRIANSALFPEIPAQPVPFVFPGFARMGVAVKEGSEFNFGDFNTPQGLQEFYAVGAIIYETVFGDFRLMPAAFKIDIGANVFTPISDLDWSLWEAEMRKARRRER